MGAILTTTNPTGSLSCEGVNFNTAAWGIFEDLTVLLAPSEFRGSSITVPHQDGRVPVPVRIDEATFEFKFPVAGDFDASGVAYADPVQGFVSNLFALRAVTDPPGIAAPVTRDVVYTVPGYGTATAACQLFLDATAELKIGTETQFGRPAALKRCLLRVRCPDGLFTLD